MNAHVLIRLSRMLLLTVIITLVVFALLYALQHSHLPLFAPVS
jgi:predicted secreted protein